MRSLAAVCRRRADPLRAMTATGLVIALASHDGDTWLHIGAGLLFAIAAAGHILANTRWIRTVARRATHGLPRHVVVDVTLDVLTALLAVATVATGSVVAGTPASATRATFADSHGLLASALVLVVSVHVARHWSGHQRRRKAGRRRGGEGRTVPGQQHTRRTRAGGGGGPG